MKAAAYEFKRFVANLPGPTRTRLMLPAHVEKSAARVVLISDTDPDTGPPTIKLDASWNHGFYLFVPARERSDKQWADLAADAWRLIAGTTKRFVWVDERDRPTGPSISVKPDGSSVVSSTTLPFGTITLNVASGTKIKTVGGADTSVTLVNPTNQAGVGSSVYMLSRGSAIGTQYARSDLQIVLFGDEAGCLQTSFQSTTPQRGTSPLWEFLDTSTYFGFPQKIGSSVRTAVFGGRLAEHPPAAPVVEVLASFDPNEVYAGAHGGSVPRTRFSFDARQPGSKRQFRTPMRTSLGHRIHLVAEDNGYLIFNRRPENPNSSYVVPSGAFELRVADDTNARSREHRLVLGTSGAEYVTFTAGRDGSPGDCIWFEPDQPAMLTGKPTISGSDLTRDAREPIELTNAATTSWFSIVPRVKAISYFAQPDDAALYGEKPAGTKAIDGSDMILGFTELPLKTFERVSSRAHITGPNGMAPVPFFPMGGHVPTGAGTLAVARGAEAQVIQPKRRLGIKTSVGTTKRLKATTADGPRTTPTGLIGQVQADQLLSLTLATTDGQKLELPLDDTLRDVFMRNRVFAVMTKVPSGLYRRVTISGWSFDVFPTDLDHSNSDTILIFKFYDEAFDVLINDTSLWAEPEQLNNGPLADVQARLRAFLKGTIEGHEKDAAAYQRIFDALTNPRWRGILAINAAPIPAALPEQVQGLLGGITIDTFRAHHVGIEISDVGREKPPQANDKLEDHLSVKHSSLFGLIDYNRPLTDVNPPASGPKTDYRFVVPQLQVRFESSEIKSFKCKVAILVPTLFFDKASQKASPDHPLPPNVDPNVICFEGHYEAHGDPPNRRETYSFIHEREHVFEIGNSILKQITISKLEFSTVRVERPSGDVTSRFALWGSLAFGNDVGNAVDLFSFKDLRFSDLALEMKFRIGQSQPPKIEFDPGTIVLDVSSSARPGSVLDKLPLKLKSLIASGKGTYPNPHQLTASDLGFFSLDFGRPQSPGLQFGLVFNLDLGSLGALVSAAKGLTVDILLGWSGDADRGLFAGIKLPESSGGKKEIGFEGILKLYIEDFRLQKAKQSNNHETYIIRLYNCILDLLHIRLPPGAQAKPPPDKPRLDAILFVDPDVPEKIGWFIGYDQPGEVGPIKIDFLGVGQRIKVEPARTCLETLDKVKSMVKAVGKPGDGSLEKLLSYYDPNAGWLVASRLMVAKAVDIAFVIDDPSLCCVHLDLIEVLKLDVLYRKISDEIGVFSIDWELPGVLRHIQAGAAAITLPNIGVDLFSNGDFRVDLGFPRGLDFSRSFRLEIGIFTGSGGFYLAKLSGQTSDLLPSSQFGNLLVLQAGLALRVGIGREFDIGILHGGVSITAFGIIEGAFGYEKFSIDTLTSPTAIALLGQLGLLGELYGAVDFGIVRAVFSIRIWALVGFRIRTNSPTLLYLDAGVEVSVTVVIGRIRVFGHTIEIRISFHFRKHVHLEWQLGSGKKADEHLTSRDVKLRLAAPDLAWNDFTIDWGAHGSPPQPILLRLAPEVTVVDGATPEAHYVATMAIERSPDTSEHALPGLRLFTGTTPFTPFEWVAMAFGAWAIKTLSTAPAGTPATDPLDRPIDDELLAGIEALLRVPTSLARCGTKPLTYARIARFLRNNFRFQLAACEPGDQQIASAFFPPPPVTELRASSASGPVWLWDRGPLLGPAEQDRVATFFNEMHIEFEKQTGGSAQIASTDPSLATVLFQDYFELVVKGVVDELRRARDRRDAPSTLWELFEEMHRPRNGDDNRFTVLANMASRFFLHGLRIPAAPAARRAQEDRALFRLAGLQDQIYPNGIPTAPAPFSLTASIRDTPDADSWCTGSATATIDGPDAVARLRAIVGANPPDPILQNPSWLPYLKERPVSVAFSHRISWKTELVPGGGEVERQILPAPMQLASLLADAPSGLKTVPMRTTFKDGSPSEPTPLEGDWRFATVVELSVQRVPHAVAAASGAGGSQLDLLPTTYLLRGADEQNRRLLDVLFATGDKPFPAGTEVSLLYEQAPAVSTSTRATVPTSGLQSAPRQTLECFVLRTNLSTDPNPSDALLAVQATSTRPMAADLDASNEFARIVRECSIVNSGGYYLSHIPKLPDYLFATSDRPDRPARLVMVVRFPATHRQRIAPYHNAIITDHANPLTADDLVSCELAEKSRWDVGLDRGCMGLRMYRRQPDKAGLDSPAGSDPSAHIENLYNLVEWGCKGTILVERKPDTTLPVGPTPVVAKDGAPNKIDEDKLRPDERLADLTQAGVRAGDWRYEVMLPVYKWTADNLAIPNDENRSRYSAVGSNVRVGVAFRDCFGNRLQRWQRQLTATVEYFDALIPVSEWPLVLPRYWASGPRQLAIELRFDHESARGADLEAYRRHYKTILDQLTDENVEPYFRTTLLGDDGVPLRAKELAELRRFVRDVSAALATTTPAAVRPFRLDTRIATKHSDFFELIVELGLRRTRFVSDSAATKLPAVRDVRSTVLPAAVETLPQGSPDFATAFDLKLAVGVSSTGERITFGVPTTVFDLTIESPDGPRAIYVAPRPLRTDLVSMSDIEVAQPDFDSGVDASRKQHISNADLDELLRTFCDQLERLLAPETSVPATKLYADTPDEGPIAAILRSKNTIAHALAGNPPGAVPRRPGILTPLFNDRESLDIDAAREIFRQRVQLDLRHAFATDGIAQFKVKRKLSKGSRGTLYGRVIVESTTADPAKDYRLATAKLDVPPQAEARASTRPRVAPTEPVFSFAYDAKFAEADAAPRVTLKYEITHIQYDRGSASTQTSDPDTYETANWLRLLGDSPPRIPIGSAPVPLPVALRQYPEPPKLHQPTWSLTQASPTSDPAAQLANARKWNFSFSFDRRAIAQDLIEARVRFNTREGSARALGVDPTRLLLEALVSFRDSHGAVQKELALLATGGADPDRVRRVLSFLEKRVAAVATTLDAYLQPPGATALGGLETKTDTYTIEDDISDKRKYSITIKRVADGTDPATREIEIEPRRSNGGPWQYTPVSPGHVVYSAIDASEEELKRLRRRVTLTKLDVMQYENALAGIRLVRNSNLLAADGLSTTAAFIYKTAWQENIESLTPQLEITSPIDISKLVPNKPGIAAKLTAALEALSATSSTVGYRRISFHSRFGFDLGQVDLPTPLFFWPPEMVSSVASTAQALADRVTSWSAGTWVSDEGRYVFDVVFFATLTSKRVPILRLSRLELPVKAATSATRAAGKRGRTKGTRSAGSMRRAGRASRTTQRGKRAR